MTLSQFRVKKTFRSPSTTNGSNEIEYKLFTEGQIVAGYIKTANAPFVSSVIIENKYALPLDYAQYMGDYIEQPCNVSGSEFKQDTATVNTQQVPIEKAQTEQTMDPNEKLKQIVAGASPIIDSTDGTNRCAKFALVGAVAGIVYALVSKKSLMICTGSGAFAGYLICKGTNVISNKNK